MKRINNLRSIIIISTIGVLSIALIVIAFIFKSNNQQTAELTSNVRASSLTYKRELDLIAGVSPTTPVGITNTPAASPSSSLFPTTTITATQSATLSATLTVSPTMYMSPTDYFIATDTATPTTIHNLPRTGWTQNVSAMFVAASVLMFLSFLF